MGMNSLRLAFLLWLISAAAASAQCVNPDFAAPSAACKDQRISLVPDNTYNSYEWDLCSGELAGTPTASILTNSYGGYGYKMELVENNGDYYGFFLTRGTNRLYRLDFGTDVNNPPIMVDLGGLGKGSNTWNMIEIVKEGNDYIGFIVDQSAIYRLNFGNSPANTPQPLETFYSGSLLNVSRDAVTVNEGGNRYLFVANSGNDKIVRFKFNSSFAEAVTSTTIDSFSVTNAIANHGISIIKDCDKWYLVTSSITVAQVFKIAMNGLSDINPTITSYGVPSPGGVAVVKDNNTFMIFAQALNPTSSIYRLTFGSDFSGNPVSTDELKDFGYAPNAGTFGFAMYKVKSDWLAVSAENTGANMYRITFPQSCLSTTAWSTERNPVITTQNAGSFNVTLDVTNGSGLHSSKSRSIAVSNSTSPDIDFTSTNICAANDVNFSAQNTSGNVTSYNWNFGDMTSSSAANPTHQFAAGTYNVELTATASSTGCSNTAAHPLKIYSAPTADFQVPSGLVCTNNDFTFTNSVTDIYEGSLSYQWFVGATQVSTTRDLVYAFNSTGSNDVKLVTSIPGCSSNVTKTISGILPGPSAGYTIDGQCQATTVNFTNTSTGNATSYSWDFGNGGTGNSTNASTSFDTQGTYTVSLKAFGSNSCVTTVKKDLVIYSKPTANFVIDLPPFSCSGTPSQFHDATGAPTDSNIQSWSWNYGDAGTGTGKNPVHTYVNAGPYNVNLSVTTDKGCVGTVAKQVTITQSPTAAFNVDAACVNQATKLSDVSTGGIATWQWKIGSVVYNTQNIQHTFSTPGSYSVQLNVTGTNSCTNSLTKQVIVPVVPAVVFEVRNPCERQAATFTDITSSTADPVVERNWTFNNSANATGTSADFTFATSGSYNAALQVKTTAGCVYNGSRLVTINPTPVASFTMSDESGPPPLHVFFTNTSTGAVSYEWNFNDGNPISTVTSPDYTYSEIGDYPVNLIAYNTFNCKDAITKVVSVVVPLNELAIEDFTLVQPQGTDAYRGYLKVRNNGNYRIDGFFVTYGIGGGLQLRETVVASLNKGEVGTFILGSEFLNPGSSAYICAELVDDTNLMDNKACKVFSDQAIILNSYPNPADVYLNIESVLPSSGMVHIRLYTSSGGLAYDKTFDAGTGLSRLSLDVQNLSPGIYVAVISAGGTTTSRRVMIAR